MSEDLKYTIDADDNPLRAALQRGAAAFKVFGDGIGNVTAGIQGALGGVNKSLAMVTAVLAGGAAIKGSIDATKEFTGEAGKLARVLGINATEASTLNVALGDIYTDADTFAAAAGKMAKELRTNESAMQGMGLQTRNADGSLRPLMTLMMDSVTIVNSYKQGVDRNIAAQQLWGKSADEFAPLLKLNGELLEAAAEKQRDLGLVVGKENVEANMKYKAAMNDVGDVMLAVKKVVGDAMMPILTQLGEWFSAVAPPAVFAFKIAINTLVTALQAVMLALKIVFDLVRALADPLFTLGSAVRKLLTGDLSGATKDMQNMFSSWGDQLGGVWDKVKSDSARTWKEIGDLWSQPTQAKAPNVSGRSASGLVKSGKDDSQVKTWEAELNAMKQALADKNAVEGTFFEFSKERERDFWKEKLSLTTAGTKDAAAVQSKLTASTLAIQQDAFDQRVAMLKREQAEAEQDYSTKAGLAAKELALIAQRYGSESKQAEDSRRAIVDIERQARDQRRQLREQELAEVAAAGLQRVTLERQALQFAADAGIISNAQLLAEQASFEQRRYDIQAQALQQRALLVDPTKNPVEYARINNELLELERQHQLALSQIQQQSTLESTQRYRTMFGSMESGFASVFKSVLNGTMSISQGIKALFRAVGDAVTTMLANMAAQWLIQQIAQRVMGKVTALSQVGANAAVAGSAAFASIAAIPIVGPFMAPAAAAAAYTGALSFAATIPAAAKGYDIPSGVNPITQLHQREMVLPEEQADAVRSMAQNGSSGGGNPIQITAWDAQGVERWLRRGGADQIATALRGTRRNFSTG